MKAPLANEPPAMSMHESVPKHASLDGLAPVVLAPGSSPHAIDVELIVPLMAETLMLVRRARPVNDRCWVLFDGGDGLRSLLELCGTALCKCTHPRLLRHTFKART